MIDQTKNIRIIQIIKIVLINLFVAIGVFIFDWEIFDVALTYLIDLAITFLISFIDHYFIRKETRENFFLSLIILIIVSAPLYGILVILAGTFYYITGPKSGNIQESLSTMSLKIETFEFSYVICSIGILHVIIFLIQKKFSKNNTPKSLWNNLERIFYVNAFIGLGAILYSFLPHNKIVGLMVFVAIKVFVDYFLDIAKDNSKK